jgi:glycosyltransferase involved in cell wall biosynthesis
VIVGRGGWQTEALAQRLRSHDEAGRRLHWLEGLGDEGLEHVYSAATCLVAASVDEGFGLPVVEAARRGVPIVARDVPVFREVAGEHAFYFKGSEAQDLAQALEGWLLLFEQGRHPRPDGMGWSTWRESATRLACLLTRDDYQRRQLLVDVSELVRHDAGTGIQRVVRSVLNEWLHRPPAGWRVEPVYAGPDTPYRYARRFVQRFLEQPGDLPDDDIIEHAPGDMFFALDLQPEVQIAQRDTYRALRRRGVGVKFLVYDLLPVLLPHRFPPGGREGFEAWLQVVAESDGAVCISRAVADELHRWLHDHVPALAHEFEIGWFHLAADLPVTAPPLRGVAARLSGLDVLRGRTTFLMVGTIEPRKGHALVLAAFEQLWREGRDINLVIVGKQGWMVDELVQRLRSHPQHGTRLLWLEGVGDERLEASYALSDCLIAASEGEGYGLPLVEAAQRGVPIVARDIPVFREVASDHAHFFTDASPEGLAESLSVWLKAYEVGRHPRSVAMPRLTWRESTERLCQVILGSHAISAGDSTVRPLAEAVA